MSSDAAHPEPQTKWHSIRPWAPPVSLSVREITSVSVTFTLSANIPDPTGDLEPLSALGLIPAEEDGDNDSREERSTSHASDTKGKSIISDALAKGVSVEVNNSLWQRVIIRMDDRLDEAIIIIYGLMPGREYDIKLGLVQGDSNGTLHQQVTTQEIDLEPSEIATEPESPDFDHSSLSDPPPSTPSTSPTRTLPNTPPSAASATTPLTVEERLSQLQHKLGLLDAERETLTASLKSTRRDSQKADASLRSEIDVLKRASEKHVAADHRAKQKILSLQEALKRAQTITRETEELVKEVEQSMPQLNQQRRTKESEYAKVKENADRAKKERDLHVEKENKKLETMKGELAGLTNKMDKLTAKKEKLESGTIMDLEEQLRAIEHEIEQAETTDTHQAYAFPSFVEQKHEFSTEDHVHSENAVQRPSSYAYTIDQRLRAHQPANLIGPIGRPIPPAPIQRPTVGEPSLLSQQTSRGHVSRQSQPQQPQAQQTTRSTRSSSVGQQHQQHQQTSQSPLLHANPHRHSSLKASTTSPSITFATPSLSVSNTSSSPPTNITSTTSTLSSRAPAFEPGRPIKTSNGNFGTTSTTMGTSSGFSVTPSPVPVQRPTTIIGSNRALGFSNAQNKPKANHQISQQGGLWAARRSSYDGGRD